MVGVKINKRKTNIIMNKQQILNNISEIKNLQGTRVNKYRRNYRFYNYTSGASLENLKNPTVVGYLQNRDFGERYGCSRAAVSYDVAHDCSYSRSQ